MDCVLFGLLFNFCCRWGLLELESQLDSYANISMAIIIAIINFNYRFTMDIQTLNFKNS